VLAGVSFQSDFTLNKYAKLFLSLMSGAVAVVTIFGVITWLVMLPEQRDEFITCHFPMYDDRIENSCDCWYLEAGSETKKTKSGVGCNAAFFDSMVGSSLPRCKM